MINEEKPDFNLLCGLSRDLTDEKYLSLGVAVNIFTKKTFTRGSTIGFDIGKRRFVITRKE